MTGGKRGEGLIREGHGETRTFLRIGGPATLVVAAVLIIIGGIKMFSGDPSVEMGDDGWFEAQTRASFTGFALAAGGLILLAVGVSMTKFGYMGAVARYSASEVAPVGTDTINYVGQEARPGLTAIGSAIGSGLAAGRGGGATTMVRCHKCNDENAADAKFCDECEAALAKTKACTSCGELNDPDARFCDDCGTRLT